MKRKQSTIRLVMENLGELHKFFWMSFDKNDDSLYFNFYPLRNQSGLMKHAVAKANPTTGIVAFPIKGIKESVVESAKYTYHQSGFIHLRLKDASIMEKGLEFLPFDEIQSYIQFLTVVPSHFFNYPKIEKTQLEKDNNIIISTYGFGNEAFSVEIFLLKKSVDHQEIPCSARVYRDVDAQSKDYPFKIMVRVAASNKPWSNRQVLVFPTINKKLSK